MLKTLKFNGPEDTFHFTSDSHWHHDKPFIVQKRGYQTVAEHDAELVAAWNAVVRPTDTVFHLGDLYTYSNKSIDVLRLLSVLQFDTLYLLWGNHRASVKQLYHEEIQSQFGFTDVDGYSKVEIYPLTKLIEGRKKIIFLGHYAEIMINGQLVVLSHYALRTWYKNHKLSWCCCGHSHQGDSYINATDTTAKILDVGVDGFGHPITMATVRAIMDTKGLDMHDHHEPDEPTTQP